ncbi:putative rhamnosyltransferase [Corynebacterium afermentans]
MDNLKMKAPFVFYTRFGLGIYDERWLDFRLKAFETFTLPSLSALFSGRDQHLVFIDRDMPKAQKIKMRDLLRSFRRCGLNTRMVSVDYHFDLPAVLDEIIWCEFGPDPIYLGRVDDDDALRFDTIHRVKEAALRDPNARLLISNSRVLEYFPVEKMALVSPFSETVNVAYGTPDNLKGYASVGHKNLKKWAARNKISHVAINDDEPLLLYNRHRQASSRFGSRRSAVRDHADSFHLESNDLVDFGIDPQAVNEFRIWASEQPYAKQEPTWTITQAKVDDFHHEFIRMRKAKLELVGHQESFLLD